MIAVALVVLVLGAVVFAVAVRNHRDPDRNGETVEPEPVPPAAPWSPVVTPPPDGGEATVDVEPEVEPEVTVGRTKPPKRTAEVAELLKKARDAEKLADWNEVVRNANLALDQGQSHPGALYLFAKGKYHVGEFRAAMEALEYIPVRELTADAARLLADAHLKLEIPNLLGARKVLGRARKAHPKDAEVAAALARLLMDVGERTMVRELVVDAKASGLEHAELDRLHEELVVKPRKERLAAFEELAKKAEEHFAAARYKQAIDTAEDAKKTRDTTCLSVLLVEAYTRVEKFDRADRALESLRRLLRDAKGRQKDCGFEQDPEVLGHWADYFAGRNAYLRYLRGGKKELLVRARADLDRLVARADARKHPDLVALARTYRGCVMARTVRNAQLALDALIKEFRSTVRNAQVEVIQAQAEAYVYVAGKAEVDDHVKIEKQEDELRREKAKMAENRRLAREARKRRQEKDYEDLSEAMEKNRQRIAGLEEALDAQKGLREFKTRALNKAMGRVSTWLSTKKRLKEAYYVAGRVYFEKGVVSGDAGMFRNAVNRLKESAKLGENSPALYDMLGKSYEYRGSFRLDAARSYLEAYRRGPSPDRCIRAADAFKAARNTPQALKVLEAGSKIFPGDAGIERMLERLRG